MVNQNRPPLSLNQARNSNNSDKSYRSRGRRVVYRLALHKVNSIKIIRLHPCVFIMQGTANTAKEDKMNPQEKIVNEDAV